MTTSTIVTILGTVYIIIVAKFQPLEVVIFWGECQNDPGRMLTSNGQLVGKDRDRGYETITKTRNKIMEKRAQER